jgi:hypothetical protein
VASEKWIVVGAKWKKLGSLLIDLKTNMQSSPLTTDHSVGYPLSTTLYSLFTVIFAFRGVELPYV